MSGASVIYAIRSVTILRFFEHLYRLVLTAMNFLVYLGMVSLALFVVASYIYTHVKWLKPMRDQLLTLIDAKDATADDGGSGGDDDAKMKRLKESIMGIVNDLKSKLANTDARLDQESKRIDRVVSDKEEIRTALETVRVTLEGLAVASEDETTTTTTPAGSKRKRSQPVDPVRLDELNDSVVRLKRQVDSHESLNASLKTTVESVLNDLNEAKSVHASLQIDLENVRSKLNGADVDVGALRSTVTATQNELSEYKKVHDTLTQSLDQVLSQVTSTESTHASLTDRLNALDATLIAYKSYNDTVTPALNNLRTELDAAKAELTSRIGTVAADVDAKLAKAVATNESAKIKIEEVHKTAADVADSLKRIVELESSVNELRVKVDENKKAAANADKLLVAHKKEVAELIEAHKSGTSKLLDEYKTNAAKILSAHELTTSQQCKALAEKTLKECKEAVNVSMDKCHESTLKALNESRSNLMKTVESHEATTANTIEEHKAAVADVVESYKNRVERDLKGYRSDLDQLTRDHTNTVTDVIDLKTRVIETENMRVKHNDEFELFKKAYNKTREDYETAIRNDLSAGLRDLEQYKNESKRVFEEYKKQMTGDFQKYSKKAESDLAEYKKSNTSVLKANTDAIENLKKAYTKADGDLKERIEKVAKDLKEYTNSNVTRVAEVERKINSNINTSIAEVKKQIENLLIKKSSLEKLIEDMKKAQTELGKLTKFMNDTKKLPFLEYLKSYKSLQTLSDDMYKKMGLDVSIKDINSSLTKINDRLSDMRNRTMPEQINWFNRAFNLKGGAGTTTETALYKFINHLAISGYPGYVEPAEYTIKTMEFNQTNAKPFQIIGFDPHSTIIRGTIKLKNVKNVTIRGLTLDTLELTDSSNVKVENCIIDKLVWSSSASTAKMVTNELNNCTFKSLLQLKNLMYVQVNDCVFNNGNVQVNSCNMINFTRCKIESASKEGISFVKSRYCTLVNFHAFQCQCAIYMYESVNVYLDTVVIECLEAFKVMIQLNKCDQINGKGIVVSGPAVASRNDNMPLIDAYASTRCHIQFASVENATTVSIPHSSSNVSVLFPPYDTSVARFRMNVLGKGNDMYKNVNASMIFRKNGTRTDGRTLYNETELIDPGEDKDDAETLQPAREPGPMYTPSFKV